MPMLCSPIAEHHSFMGADVFSVLSMHCCLFLTPMLCT